MGRLLRQAQAIAGLDLGGASYSDFVCPGSLTTLSDLKQFFTIFLYEPVFRCSTALRPRRERNYASDEGKTLSKFFLPEDGNSDTVN